MDGEYGVAEVTDWRGAIVQRCPKRPMDPVSRLVTDHLAFANRIAAGYVNSAV